MENKDFTTNKTGVFLARFQPLHNAHMYIIETALKECDRLVIMLGSSNKKDMLRNPFDFELRKEMLKNSLQNKDDYNRIEIYDLPDWSQESIKEDNLIWGRYLYYNIVSRARQKQFSFFYNDDPEILKAWFEDDIIKNINLRFLDRQSVFDGLSATKIRNAMLNFSLEDKEYLKKCLPIPVYNDIDNLRDIWLKVYNNPKSDFTME